MDKTKLTEDEGLPEETDGPYTCCKCCAPTWNDDDWCNLCLAESRSALKDQTNE